MRTSELKKRTGALLASLALLGTSLGLTATAIAPASAAPTSPTIEADGVVKHLNTGLDATGKKVELTNAEADAQFGNAGKKDVNWEVADFGGNGRNLGYEAAGQNSNGTPRYDVATVQKPDAATEWEKASIAGWNAYQDPNAQWISGSKTEFTRGQNIVTDEIDGKQVVGVPRAFYYRVKFNIQDEIVASQMRLKMAYAADDLVAGIWVNEYQLPDVKPGPRQSGAEVDINYGLKPGENTITVQVNSWPHTQGFRASFTSKSKDGKNYVYPQPVAPKIDCTSDPSILNTGVDSAGKPLPVNETKGVDDIAREIDPAWTVAGGYAGLAYSNDGDGSVGVLPSKLTYQPAIVQNGSGQIAAAAPWGVVRPDPNNPKKPNVGDPTGLNQDGPDTPSSFFYRTQLNVSEAAAKNLVLVPTFEVDDFVAGVWVNGKRVWVNSTLRDYLQKSPDKVTAYKYYFEENQRQGYGPKAPNDSRNLTLNDKSYLDITKLELSGFKPGVNTIDIQVMSHSGAEWLKADFKLAPGVTESGGLCPQYEKRIPSITCDRSGIAQLATGLDMQGAKIALNEEVNKNFAYSTISDPRWEVADAKGEGFLLGQGAADPSLSNVTAISESKLPDSDVQWAPARAAGWKEYQTDKAQWITGRIPFADSQPYVDEEAVKAGGSKPQRAFYYRLKFNVFEEMVDKTNLTMHYSPDDQLGAIWVNGQQITDAPTGDPKNGNWKQEFQTQIPQSSLKAGTNEIIVQVNSWATTQAFRAWFEDANTDNVCPAPIKAEVGCNTPANVFNTGINPETGDYFDFVTDGVDDGRYAVDRHWQGAGGTKGYPLVADGKVIVGQQVGDMHKDGVDYAPAVVPGWWTSPNQDHLMGAITTAASLKPTNNGAGIRNQEERDGIPSAFYYRNSFKIADAQVAENLALIANFSSKTETGRLSNTDDYVGAVWVNGEQVYVNQYLKDYLATKNVVTYKNYINFLKEEYGADWQQGLWPVDLRLDGFKQGDNTIEIQMVSHLGGQYMKATFDYAPEVIANGLCPADPEPEAPVTEPAQENEPAPAQEPSDKSKARKDKADKPRLMPKTGSAEAQGAVLAALTLSIAAAVALRGRKQR